MPDRASPAIVAHPKAGRRPQPPRAVVSPPVTEAVRPVIAKTRDPRLDVFRGLCLVMIFINHIPGNVYEAFTSRNWGHSDAAEGFVLMSGIAAGLAYSPAFRRPMQLWTGFGRVWKRVWTLYLVHLMITAAALAIAAVLLRYFDIPGLFQQT